MGFPVRCCQGAVQAAPGSFGLGRGIAPIAAGAKAEQGRVRPRVTARVDALHPLCPGIERRAQRRVIPLGHDLPQACVGIAFRGQPGGAAALPPAFQRRSCSAQEREDAGRRDEAIGCRLEQPRP